MVSFSGGGGGGGLGGDDSPQLFKRLQGSEENFVLLIENTFLKG